MPSENPHRIITFYIEFAVSFVQFADIQQYSTQRLGLGVMKLKQLQWVFRKLSMNGGCCKKMLLRQRKIHSVRYISLWLIFFIEKVMSLFLYVRWKRLLQEIHLKCSFSKHSPILLSMRFFEYAPLLASVQNQSGAAGPTIVLCFWLLFEDFSLYVKKIIFYTCSW